MILQHKFFLLVIHFISLVFSQKNDLKVVLPTCCDLKWSKSRNTSSICTVSKEKYIKGRNEIHVPWEWDIPSELIGLEDVSRFLLNVKDLKCESSQLIYLNYTFGDEDPSNPKLQIDSKGYVHWIKSRLEIDYFHISQYCIHGIADSNIIIKTCNSQCTADEPCIRKCCPINSVFNPQPGVGCMNANVQWTPKFFRDPSNPETVYDPIPIIFGSPKYIARAPPTFQENCLDGAILFFVYDQNVSQILENSHGIFGTQTVKFRLGSNGKLNIRNINSRKWEELGHENYCLDGLQMPGNVTITEGFKNTLEEQIMFICVNQEANVIQKPAYYGGLAIFASTFALLTVITYFLLFEKQNIHGWTIMSHSSCVFLFFICLGIAHLTNSDKYDPINPRTTWKQIGCKINATLAHYLFISTFCWLLLISFDLWYTFRSLTSPNKGKGLRRFFYYSLFGWGLPFLTVGISWILEYEYKNDENSMVPVPLYGEGYCFVGNGSHLYYIYIPISILMGLNLISFILASVSLIRLQQGAKFARQNINTEKQSYMLFVKLFIVVGALWIFELISFYTSGGHIEWYWQIFDSLNLLQPVAIFGIFVLKWEMINALYTKYKFLRPFLWPIRQTLLFFRNESSSSSHPKRKSNVTLKSTTEPRLLSSKL